MPRSYKETDILFYGKENIDFDIFPETHGYLLTWKKKEGVSGYKISRRRIGEEGWETVVTVDSHIQEFRDLKPPANATFEYKIEAVIEGDFLLNEDGDFKLTEDHQSAEQDILNRIRTQKGDWRSHQNLGANLEELEGEPNTRETGDRGAEQIFETLTYDGRFRDDDIHIRAVPVSINQIDYFTIIDSDEDKPIIVRNPLNL